MTGQEFKARRLALGYTSRDTIAAAFEISPRTVQYYESGARPIPKVVSLALDALCTSKAPLKAAGDRR